jgi:pimeloyl-ACP methyl ester carboxylesterase
MSTLASSNAPDSAAVSTATAIRDLDSDDLAALRGQPLRVPALFIGGDKDGPTVWGTSAIARFPEMRPFLKGSHILENCGHWIQHGEVRRSQSPAHGLPCGGAADLSEHRRGPESRLSLAP